MIDEIYTAQRYEYCNGAFVGLNDNGLPVSGKYRDVVCLVCNDSGLMK